MISKELRRLVVAQLEAGRLVSEILPMFKTEVSRATLFRIAKDFQAGGAVKPKKRKGQPLRKMTPSMAARMIRLLTKAKHHHSIRAVARLLKVSHTTVKNHLRKRGINTWKKVKRQLIPESQRQVRRKCCMDFRKTYRIGDLPDLLFVDECYVTVKKHFNHQNERAYGKDFNLIPAWKKYREFPKSPLSAMVFGGVTREGRTPLVVLPSGFRLNQTTYLEECLIPMQENLPNQMDPRKTILVQDKAPCHRAASVQLYLKENFPRFIPFDKWPPNSPDLNVLDYCVWSLLKEALNKHGLIPSFAKLKELLLKEWEAIPQEAIQAAVDSWLRRVRGVEAEKGGHIE